MTVDNPRRFTFIFGPPTDDAAAWNLHLDDFARRLTESFGDDSWTKKDDDLGPRRESALSFEVRIGGGPWLDGLTTMPFPGTGTVSLKLVTPGEAAPFVAWLRDFYVPCPDLVHFTSDAALEGGGTTYEGLPASGPVEEIEAILQRHMNTENNR